MTIDETEKHFIILRYADEGLAPLAELWVDQDNTLQSIALDESWLNTYRGMLPEQVRDIRDIRDVENPRYIPRADGKAYFEALYSVFERGGFSYYVIAPKDACRDLFERYALLYELLFDDPDWLIIEDHIDREAIADRDVLGDFEVRYRYPDIASDDYYGLVRASTAAFTACPGVTRVLHEDRGMIIVWGQDVDRVALRSMLAEWWAKRRRLVEWWVQHLSSP